VLRWVYHVWRIKVAFVMLGFGSFLCSVVAGSIKVAFRVSIALQSAVLGPGLSPLGCLASMTLVGG
jgi:hypothetical protein